MLRSERLPRVHQGDGGEHQGKLDGVIATSPKQCSVEMAFMILPFTVLKYSVFFCCSLSLDYLQLHPTTTINCWHNIIQESPKTKKYSPSYRFLDLSLSTTSLVNYWHFQDQRPCQDRLPQFLNWTQQSVAAHLFKSKAKPKQQKHIHSHSGETEKKSKELTQIRWQHLLNLTI